MAGRRAVHADLPGEPSPAAARARAVSMVTDRRSRERDAACAGRRRSGRKVSAMHMTVRRDRRDIRRRVRSWARAVTCGLAAACSLAIVLGAGQAVARSAQPAPATSPPTIVCRGGRGDPATCRRFDASVPNRPHRTACVAADGPARVRFSLSYPKRVRRADARGAERRMGRRCG
jgi:hypothetical protein